MNEQTEILQFLVGVGLAHCPCSFLEWSPSSYEALSFLKHLFPDARKNEIRIPLSHFQFVYKTKCRLKHYWWAAPQIITSCKMTYIDDAC